MKENSLGLTFGILGYLSNAKQLNSVKISNPGTKYVNRIGLDWGFTAGLKALSQNGFDPGFRVNVPSTPTKFPEWGRAPSDAAGKRIDFDAGLMLKESFVHQFFQTLYQAGFFNIQAQESLLKGATFSLNPFKTNFGLKIMRPDGKDLTAEDFADAGLSLRFSTAPSVAFRNQSEVLVTVPEFEFSYKVKAKDTDFFTVARFKARFNVVGKAQFEGGSLSFVFSDKPIENFVMLDRGGLSLELSSHSRQRKPAPPKWKNRFEFFNGGD